MRRRAAVGALAVVCGLLTAVRASGPASAAPGDITTVAGSNGEGQATAVGQHPRALAFSGPMLYITDPAHNVVRALDTRTGTERVLAGNGFRRPDSTPQHPGGDGGRAIDASFSLVFSVATDAAGNVYVVDAPNGTVRKTDPAGANITTVAGSPRVFPCCPAFGGDGGPARDAELAHPQAVAVDRFGNLFIADTGHHRIRKVDTAGQITTFAGDGSETGPIAVPTALAFDPSGNLYVLSRDALLSRVSPVGIVTHVAGTGESGSSGDGGPAIAAQINADAIATDAAGNVYLAGGWVRKVTVGTGTITTLPTPPTPANAVGVAVDASGAVYVADDDIHGIRRIDGAGVTTVAGNGHVRFSGDGGPATKAELGGPRAVAVAADGTQYIADGDNDRVRKVTPAGTISTLASIHRPRGITVDGLGRPYVFADWNKVFRLDPLSGAATLVAGGGERYAAAADGHPALEAALAFEPSSFTVDMAFDPLGNLYFADAGINRVRKLDPAGILTTVAWGGSDQYRCGLVNPNDPVPSVSCPTGVAVDGAGNLYYCEYATRRVKRVNTTGTTTDLSGIFAGGPSSVAVDGANNVFVADVYSSVVGIISPAGEFQHVAGTDHGFSGDGGPADQALLFLPAGLTISGADLYIADAGNGRIRRVTGAAQPSSTLTVRTWGWNGLGQVGDGTVTDRPGPTQVPGLGRVDHMAAGYHHTLEVKNGQVWAWGWNALGQLGNGTTADSAVPVRVQGLNNVVRVAAGAYHSMAVDSICNVFTWGWNAVGQLGTGTNVDSRVPTLLKLPAKVDHVSAGAFHSIAQGRDGRVFTWGWNAVGQLGDGTTFDRWAPVPVPGLTGIGFVTAGAYHSLALRSTGELYAFGWNAAGQLGDGTLTDRHLPVRALMANLVRDVSAGVFHTVALTDVGGGRVWAWGWNGVGQLGDGTTTDRRIPTLVPGLEGITDVGAGAYHSLAVHNDGTARAWGWNPVGQLGDNTTTDRLTPVHVAGLRGVVGVSGGAFHSAAY